MKQTGSIGHNKGKTDTRNENAEQAKRSHFWSRPCIFRNAPTWISLHKCPTKDSNGNKHRNKGHYARTSKQGNQNQSSQEIDKSKQSTSKSDESTHHIKKKTIEENQNHYRATMKLIGKEIELIFDTGSQ